MDRHPEDGVVAAIDAMVDQSIAHGPTDDYEKNYSEKCELCGGDWHGLAHENCPGTYADAPRDPDEDCYCVPCTMPMGLIGGLAAAIWETCLRGVDYDFGATDYDVPLTDWEEARD